MDLHDELTQLKYKPTPDMSPEAIARRLRGVSGLYKLGISHLNCRRR